MSKHNPHFFHAGTTWQDVLLEFEYSDEPHIADIVAIAEDNIKDTQALEDIERAARDLMIDRDYEGAEERINRVAEMLEELSGLRQDIIEYLELYSDTTVSAIADQIREIIAEHEDMKDTLSILEID